MGGRRAEQRGCEHNRTAGIFPPTAGGCPGLLCAPVGTLGLQAAGYARGASLAFDAAPAQRGTRSESGAARLRSRVQDVCGRRTAGETLAVGRGCMPRAHADQTWDDSDVQMSMPEREGSHAFWRVHITHVHSHAHRGRESLAHTRAHAAAGRGQKQTSWSSWRSSSSPTHGSTSRP